MEKVGKDKKTSVVVALTTTEETASTVQAAETTFQGPVYCGPKYRFGIIIPGYTGQVNPKEMNEAERLALIQRYPPAADWWRVTP